MTKLFLSYGRGDDVEPFDPATSFLARLHRDLSAAGFEVWFDRVSMPSRSLTFHQEIREAVAAADRVVLVVGPHAVGSDYVRQEWQFALGADKVVTPILRRGDYKDIPGELGGLHCEDFREGSYEFALANLIRILSEPVPPLGRLLNVPPTPAHFLPRPDRVGPLIDSLRADLDRPVVLSGVAARVGLHGMGGIGKSVLAAAVARDRRIREGFPDGVVWVTVGQNPNIPALQRQAHQALGGDGAFADNQGRDALAKLLAGKAALLILDDVWNRLDVNAFDVLGPRCRALVTTRDAGMLESLGGPRHILDLLTDSEARDLLALSAGLAPESLPQEAGVILGECGRLPLAVALCGGLLQGGMSGASIAEQLRNAAIDRIDDEYATDPNHRSVWHAIHVSVAALKEDERRRFLELAVFPADVATPTAAVATLWSQTGKLDGWLTDKLLVTLRRRSLLTVATKDEQSRVELHDLIHDYLRHATPETRPLHEALLAAYAGRCADGWATGPDDGYFFTRLRTHLSDAGRAAELPALMRDHRWLEAKAAAGVVADLLADFEAARAAVVDSATEGRFLRLVKEAIGRDLSFIARHPSTLFQCLWNSCWWYDCPEAEGHYDPPRGGWDSGGPPWARPALSPWMRAWREAKERAGPFVWVRSLRPPAVPLGGAMRAVCVGHFSLVNVVAFSPDDRVIASASGDGTVRLWDSGSGRELTRLRGHETPVTALAWSGDGKSLAGGSLGGEMLLWDTRSGRESAFPRGHEGKVRALAWSKDGRALASASEDRTVRLWDPQAWRELACLPGHDAPVTALAWSGDGRALATGTESGVVQLWDTETGRELIRLLGFSGEVISLSWSEDGRALTGRSWDGAVLLWATDSGRELGRLYKHEPPFAPSALSDDGRVLASAVAGGAVLLWDTESDRALARLCGHEGHVSALAWSGDGRTLASGSWAGTVLVWEPQSNRELARLRGHENDSLVTALVWSGDGRWLASGATDNQVRLWDPDSGRELACLCGHEGMITALAWSACGPLASGSEDGTVRVWDREYAREFARLCGHEGRVGALAWSGDGRVLASGSQDGTVRLWNPWTECELACLRGHGSEVNSLSWSEDDRELRSWDANGGELFWDTTAPELSRNKHTSEGAFPFSPYRFAAIKSEDGALAFDPGGAGSPIAWFLGGGLSAETVNGYVWSVMAGSTVYLLGIERGLYFGPPISASE